MDMLPSRSASLRAALVDRLAGCAPEIAALPVVARTLASIAITRPVLVHFTFDEPLIQDGEMRTLMTYHLADRRHCHDPACRDEVRGCCLVGYRPGRGLSLSDADAEAFVVDEPPPGPGTSPPPADPQQADEPGRQRQHRPDR